MEWSRRDGSSGVVICPLKDFGLTGLPAWSKIWMAKSTSQFSVLGSTVKLATTNVSKKDCPGAPIAGAGSPPVA